MRGGRRNAGSSGGRDRGKDHASRMKYLCYDWRREPFGDPSRCSTGSLMDDSRLEVLPERSRRTLDKRSRSVERWGDHPPWQLDYGNKLACSPQSAQRRYLPQPLPQSALEAEAVKFQEHRLLSDDISADPGRKLSWPMKERDFRRQNEDALHATSLGIKEHDVLLNKPSFFDEFSSRNRYSDQPLSSTLHSSERLASTDRFGMKIQCNEALLDRGCHGDRYHDMKRENAYWKESPLPKPHSFQPRPFSRTSSSTLAKDDFMSLRHGSIPDRLDGSIGKYLNDHLENNPYRDGPIIDSPYNELHDQPLVYVPEQHGSREVDDLRNELNRESFLVCNEHSCTMGSNFLDYGRERIDTTNFSHRVLNERGYTDHCNYLHREVSPDHHEMSQTHMRSLSNSRDVHGEIGLKSSKGHGNIAFGVEYDLFGSDASTVPKENGRRYRNSLLDYDIGMHKQGMSPAYAGPSYRVNCNNHDTNGISYGDYVSRSSNEIDLQSKFLNNQNAFVRTSPCWNEETCSNQELVRLCPSKRALLEQRSYKTSANRIIISDPWMDSLSRTPVYAKNDHGIRSNKRLKRDYVDIQDSCTLGKKQDLSRPYKHYKRSMHDKYRLQGRKFNGKGAHLIKNDPSEGSEEFKHKVHKAFLQYSKLLNMSPQRQSIFQGQGKNKKMHCFVCGRQLMDTHSLVAHTYHSLKVGLRTEHLGLHKALCVLLGWNWLVAPDGANACRSRVFSEARIIREDLILWPPLVLIHNVYSRNKSNTKEFMVSIEGLKKILKDIGIDTVKGQVLEGNLSSDSFFVVKFLATFSGLQEAEKLHKYYAEKRHGKQEFLQITSTRDGIKNQGETQPKELHDFLYGYMALAEDLDKLDAETKKRSLVKSKMDIEAIADAPLRTDNG
ncbi:hypothetical protein HPP92_009574 [Vanilla planifolia]|uniref:XS domain-containing protein n=1 Tax=Vanilla planifolia TaxID=51239 RepID=A0A835V4U4_VANPL|nr:hypothetical protein HPP92_009574 [Vanilla planifolia]